MHCDYRTSDWENSVHELDVDIVAPADALPIEKDSLDAVLLTQVLEHVSDPPAVLREAARVLKAGAGVWITVPFVWELHELPFDFWRFTPASLEQLLAAAGFVDIVIEPRSDCFTTVAQLLHNLRWAMGDDATTSGATSGARPPTRSTSSPRASRLWPLWTAAGCCPSGGPRGPVAVAVTSGTWSTRGALERPPYAGPLPGSLGGHRGIGQGNRGLVPVA